MLDLTIYLISFIYGVLIANFNNKFAKYKCYRLKQIGVVFDEKRIREGSFYISSVLITLSTIGIFCFVIKSFFIVVVPSLLVNTLTLLTLTVASINTASCLILIVYPKAHKNMFFTYLVVYLLAGFFMSFFV